MPATRCTPTTIAATAATATNAADRGYFADHDGFDTVVEDMHVLSQRAREEQPGLPFFLLGHSMGSFLSRAYAARDGAELTGLILSGTAGDPGLLGKVGQGIASVEARLRGRRHPSPLLDKLSFGQYNAAFKPNRTEFDWLSRDEAEVDKYVADPRLRQRLHQWLLRRPARWPGRSQLRRRGGSRAPGPADPPDVRVGGPGGRQRQGRPAGRGPVRPAGRPRRDPPRCTRTRATRCSTRPTATRSWASSWPGSTRTCQPSECQPSECQPSEDSPVSRTVQRLLIAVGLLLAGMVSLPLSAYFLDGPATENLVLPAQLAGMALLGAALGAAAPAILARAPPPAGGLWSGRAGGSSPPWSVWRSSWFLLNGLGGA